MVRDDNIKLSGGFKGTFVGVIGNIFFDTFMLNFPHNNDRKSKGKERQQEVTQRQREAIERQPRGNHGNQFNTLSFC